MESSDDIFLKYAQNEKRRETKDLLKKNRLNTKEGINIGNERLKKKNNKGINYDIQKTNSNIADVFLPSQELL